MFIKYMCLKRTEPCSPKGLRPGGGARWCGPSYAGRPPGLATFELLRFSSHFVMMFCASLNKSSVSVFAFAVTLTALLSQNQAGASVAVLPQPFLASEHAYQLTHSILKMHDVQVEGSLMCYDLHRSFCLGYT